MSKKQLFALFFCSLVPWTIGSGLLPLLPVCATELGATPAVAGYYLSFSYLALATGTIGAGWLSDKLQRRKTLVIVSGVVSIPAIWLMGPATNIWYLTALSAAFYFCGGMAVTLISILAGLFAEKTERGRIFGILSLTGALGGSIGGLMTGPMADRWGYPIMFAVLAVFGILWPLTGLVLKDKTVTRVHEGEASTAGERPRLGASFYLLFLASLTAAVACFVGTLGRSLAMNDLGLAAAAISVSGAIGAAVTLPLLPLIGWLSDRLGRKQFLTLCYLAGTVGLLILAVSVSLWHFWAASVLLSILFSVNMAVGPAWVTDLVPKESLGRSISLFSATSWVGGIIGFASTGYAVEMIGMATTSTMGAFLTLIAIALLIPIRGAEGERRSALHSGDGDV